MRDITDGRRTLPKSERVPVSAEALRHRFCEISGSADRAVVDALLDEYLSSSK